MEDLEAPVASEGKLCKFGAKCRRRKCKFVHPPTASDNGQEPHDSSLYQSKDTLADSAQLEDDPNHAPKKNASKKRAGKECKFGNDCHRLNCRYVHPPLPAEQEEEKEVTCIPIETTTTESPTKKNIPKKSKRQSKKKADGVETEEVARPVDTADVTGEGTPADAAAAKSPSKKSRKKCFRGNKCHRPNCPYKHPADFVPPVANDGGQQEDAITAPPPAMLEVSVLEAEMVAPQLEERAPEIPLAADLEDSMVAEAASHSPEKKFSKQRRNKRDKSISHNSTEIRRQEEEDRLIQQEEQRLELEETDDLFQDLEEEKRRLAAQEEEKRRLSADKARLEIDRIRQAKRIEQQEAQRSVQVVEEGFANAERIRAEREALERFKQIQEDELKSEEAARRLQEEERNQMDRQGERQAEGESPSWSQVKVNDPSRAQEQEDRLRLQAEKAKQQELSREDTQERERFKPGRKAAKKERRRSERKRENGSHRVQEEAMEEDLRRVEAEKQQELRHGETEEERERYKAERKAAKKERRRLEREAKAQSERSVDENAPQSSPQMDQDRSVSFSPSTIGSTGSNRENVNPEVEDEEAKKRRWQEELRRQKERAAEKKDEKQKRRRERMQEDFERQTEERTQFWQAEIADEKKTVEMLVQLCAAEFCRKNPEVDPQTLLADTDVRAKLEEAARETYRIVCKADIHSRIVVKGMKQKDLNDRNGTIQSWDEDKGKFYVGLDTKKGKNTQYMYLFPGNLEALPLSSSRKGKKKADPVHMVFIASLLPEKELMTDIYKSEIDGMKQAASLGDYIELLMKERDREEREAKELEEEEARQEEEARRRRAEQRHRENMEWERRQREYAEQKAEYQEWRRQEREAKREEAEARARGERESFYDESEHSQRCHCPRCMFEDMFFGGFGLGGGRGGGPGIFFGMGPDGPRIFFSFSDDDYDEEDEWDRQWERMHEEELAQKNEEAADVLGVEVDATEDEIKRVFRKKARKYHPDSYRADNHEDGMSKQEAEDHFKELSNAYDHLMSNFDEESSDDESYDYE